MALYLNKLKSLSRKNALFQVWLKLAQWFWTRWKCEKFTNGQMDDGHSEKFIWAFYSGELIKGNLYMFLQTQTCKYIRTRNLRKTNASWIQKGCICSVNYKFSEGNQGNKVGKCNYQTNGLNNTEMKNSSKPYLSFGNHQAKDHKTTTLGMKTSSLTLNWPLTMWPEIQ